MSLLQDSLSQNLQKILSSFVVSLVRSQTVALNDVSFRPWSNTAKNAYK